MTKVKKVKEVEDVIKVEEETIEAIIKEADIEIPKIYVADIPAQMIEPIKEDTSVPEQPTGETEIQFLQRILKIQEEGGFGRHLNGIIYDRIKSFK